MSLSACSNTSDSLLSEASTPFAIVYFSGDLLALLILVGAIANFLFYSDIPVPVAFAVGIVTFLTDEMISETLDWSSLTFGELVAFAVVFSCDLVCSLLAELLGNLDTCGPADFFGLLSSSSGLSLKLPTAAEAA